MNQCLYQCFITSTLFSTAQNFSFFLFSNQPSLQDLKPYPEGNSSAKSPPSRNQCEEEGKQFQTFRKMKFQRIGIFLIIRLVHFMHFSNARIEFLTTCGYIIPTVSQITVSHLLQQLQFLGMLILNKNLD